MQARGLPAPALQAFGGRVDVTVELAVCRLLLGDPLAAEAALRLAPDSAGRPDEGVAQFVLVRTLGSYCCQPCCRLRAPSPLNSACTHSNICTGTAPCSACCDCGLDSTQLGATVSALQVIPNPTCRHEA